MFRAALLAVLVAAGGLSLVPASAACAAPPCGPIPVVIEIRTDGPRVAPFGDEDEIVRRGLVSYYINVDNDGYWFDPEKPPVLTFKVNRQPPWVRATVTPETYTIPIADPQLLGSEGGAPDQLQFYWEAPVEIKVTRLRDPTPAEIGDNSPYVRRDGTYRVVVSATSTSSLLAPDLLGPNMGLQEGYGVKEVRIIPEINGVAWVRDATGALVPEDGILPNAAKGDAPAPLALVAALSLLGAAGWRRRRLA